MQNPSFQVCRFPYVFIKKNHIWIKCLIIPKNLYSVFKNFSPSYIGSFAHKFGFKDQACFFFHFHFKEFFCFYLQKGYINIKDKAFLIQPMREMEGGKFLHLLYENTEEIKQQRKNKIDKNKEYSMEMECVTGGFTRKCKCKSLFFLFTS